MDEINIKEFFSYLKHYILYFVLIILVAVVGVLTYDKIFKKPIYQANTTVVIAKSDTSDGTAASLNEVNASQKLANTYSEIAKSELVMNQVIENLGLHMTVNELRNSITVKPVTDTSILSISVRDLNAQLAATIANEIADVFAKQVATIYKIENVTQLSVAVPPTSPANNTLVRDLILAVAIGVLLVAGIAFLRFYLDDTVKYNDEVEKNIGLPVTGRISRHETKGKRAASELIVENSPKAIVSENIKSLRTNLQFTAVDEEVKSFLITSTNAGEGKSFISSNLAISFAQAEKRVLLIDCDLRKGRLHRLFGIPNTHGLSNLLTNDIRSWSDFVHPTKVSNLDVMTCGTYPPNPSELLASKKNKRLMTSLFSYYDIVILDGAPVGGLADSVILSSLVDETIIVVKDSFTNKADLIAVRDTLEKVGSKVAGVVFNMVNRRSTKYYNNYYYYNNNDSHKK
ncbi:polysaccharide biosynthesis tyrosine autokinase [Candidatus Saccharibacteria bacterium]|nr:polysaccharide biosynthesis tyrosine autokinase [Candidatus Saccharibacteria bacterium]